METAAYTILIQTMQNLVYSLVQLPWAVEYTNCFSAEE